MAEANTTPAAAPAIDYAKLAEAMTAALKPALTEAIKPIADNQKILADTLAALPPAAGKQGDGKQTDAAKPLDAEGVAKIVAEQLKGFTAQTQQSAEREKYIAAHLAKLPAAYQTQLGNDPAKWAEEAKTIQGQFEADFKANGGKAETLASGTTDGGKTAAKETPDFSKLPAFELLHKGVEAMPVGPAAEGK